MIIKLNSQQLVIILIYLFGVVCLFIWKLLFFQDLFRKIILTPNFWTKCIQVHLNKLEWNRNKIELFHDILSYWYAPVCVYTMSMSLIVASDLLIWILRILFYFILNWYFKCKYLKMNLANFKWFQDCKSTKYWTSIEGTFWEKIICQIWWQNIYSTIMVFKRKL